MGGFRVRLGIDFGTAHTVAMLAVADQEPRPILFDGSPLLPSAVCLDPTGRLLVGRDALHTALSRPAAFEPSPKRCIDDQTVLLDDRDVPIVELIAAPLRRVAEEAVRIAGAPVTVTTLSYPAVWGSRRRAVLLAAANQVFPSVRLVAEPVAAANSFLKVAGGGLAVGQCIVVYDFGAGTFDASVLRRTGDGFETVATGGRSDCGGLDIDWAIVNRLAETVGRPDAARWARLAHPQSTGDRRGSRQLWDNVRSGKEMLSRTTTSLLHVPLLDAEVPLGREELEELAAPIVTRTVETTRQVLADAGLADREIAALYLAGGSSRMPMVTTALHRALGIAPTLVEQPELVVAEGCLRVPVAQPNDGEPDRAAAPTPTGSTPRVRRPRRMALLSGLAVTLLAAAAGLAASLTDEPGTPVDARVGQTTSPSGSPEAGSPTSPGSPSGSPPAGSAGLVDPCVLGRWRATMDQRVNRINGHETVFTGGAGMILTYSADGTQTVDYNKSDPYRATVGGRTWTNVVRGKGSYKTWHRDGIEYNSSPKASGTNKLYLGGRLNNGVELDLGSGTLAYVCSGSSLRFVDDDISSAFVKIS
ncbi:Hsp70 family protein [Plantactinospora solaniradicis]|uniref:Hsp70 family protein n=1 Tax=Plantactinospora solaniradicis TaxID=1723736 RepID=A0ABW1KGI1_9ACTN